MTGSSTSRAQPVQPSTGPASLTRVELVWREKQIEHWIRFGREVQEQILDRRRRILSFPAGTVFAFVRWASNDYGTVVSRIDIVRAVTACEPYQTLPFVRPGGDILLKLGGWPTVERVLILIDAIEALGIDPADAAPDYWRHVHNRLTAGDTPRAYTREQHSAWLLRRRAEP
ncbi:MAG: glycosidase [Methylobacterium sp.]|nr:MAG: glycosidase [Methylobacterium sp.]